MSVVDKILMRSNTLKINPIKNNYGQAVLEYVLMLVIVMTVLLYFITGVARGTQKFAENYFGSYFRCLLETGELPQLGADGAAETECDELYEPYSFREGRYPISNSNSNSDSGDERNLADNDSGDNASAGASESGGPSNIGAGGSGGLDSNSRSRKVPLSAADKKGRSDNSDGGGGRFNNFQQSDEFGDEGSGRSTYVPVYGTMGGEEEEKSGETVKAQIDQNPEQALRGKRVPVSVSKTGDKSNVDDEPMTLPDFLKFIIIAAIILAIVIFFGGQVMQFNKSQD